jgi:hypothetical protein
MDVSIETGGLVQVGSEVEIAQESEENKNNQSFKSGTPATSSQANRRKKSPTGKEAKGKKMRVGKYGDYNKLQFINLSKINENLVFSIIFRRIYLSSDLLLPPHRGMLLDEM